MALVGTGREGGGTKVMLKMGRLDLSQFFLLNNYQVGSSFVFLSVPNVSEMSIITDKYMMYSEGKWRCFLAYSVGI